MKNRLFYLLTAILLIFLLNGCGMLSKLFHKDTEDTGTTIGIPSMHQIDYEYTGFQVDSMCVADSLPRNFDGWLHRAYQDYETSEYIVRYMYIKDLNDNYEMIYIVTPRGEIYVVSKRKVVNE